MSLYIEVYVGSKDNRKLVAECHAYNVLSLAKISDYVFTSTEFGAAHLGIPPSKTTGDIREHDRETSVWRLVEKIAKAS